NLLNNAARYTPEGGRLWLAALREGDEAVVRVRDNGVGISPEKLLHVFDLFAQLDLGPNRAQGGLGIGLTLVRRLIEMHGGSIAACRTWTAARWRGGCGPEWGRKCFSSP